MNLKLFGKNALIYAIGNIGIRASSFLLIPLYTHSLSISDYGKLVTLLPTIQIMIVFMGLGTLNAFIRFAKEYARKNQIGHLLGSTILINILGGLLVTAISISLLLPFFRKVLHTHDVLGFVILTCFAAFFQSLCHHAISYYRAMNEGMRFMICCASALLLLVVTNLVLLLILRQGVKGALMAQILTYGGLWLFILFNVVSKTGFAFYRQLASKVFKFGFPLVFAMSGDLVTDASAVYLLSLFSGLEVVAVFSLGYKITHVAVIALVLPFHLAYEPFVYANITAPGMRTTIGKLLTYFMLCFAFVAFGIAFTARYLVPVIAPPEYSMAYLVTLLMLPGIAFRGVHYVGESLLHVKNKTQVTGLVVTIFTVLSVIMNYFLIQLWGMFGAIVVFSFTVVSAAVVLMLLGMRCFPITLETHRLGIAGALSISLLSLVFFLSKTSFYVYYSVVPLAACVSIVLLYFGGFFDIQERSLIRGTLHRVKLAISS
jgi:O-antigen/teichoic acid export membrane protein